MTIELTDDDAALFAQFRKYQDQFKVLLENGVFDFLVGSKTLHKTGKDIKVIETNTVIRF